MREIKTVFDNLDAREIDYVKARANAKSDSDACRKAGVSRGWLFQHNAPDLFERAMAFKADVTYRAQMILEEAVEKAAQVKVDGLDSKDKHIKQSAATEILDRRFGKPTQRNEVTLPGAIVVKLVNDD